MRVESIVLGLSDGEIKNFLGDNKTKSSPLLKFVIDRFIYYANTTDVKKDKFNPFMGVPIERFFYFKKFNPPHHEFGVQMRLFATYYNILSQAYEPFMEPWEMDFVSCQRVKDQGVENKIESKTFLEINLSTGMAFSVKNFQNRLNHSYAKLEKLDELRKKAEASKKIKKKYKKKDKDRDDSESAGEQEEKPQNELAVSSLNTIATARWQTLRTQKTFATNNGLGKIQSTKKDGYKFSNNTGTEIRFLVSNL